MINSLFIYSTIALIIAAKSVYVRVCGVGGGWGRGVGVGAWTYQGKQSVWNKHLEKIRLSTLKSSFDKLSETLPRARMYDCSKFQHAPYLDIDDLANFRGVPLILLDWIQPA